MTELNFKTAQATLVAVFLSLAPLLPCLAEAPPLKDDETSAKALRLPPADQLLIGVTVSVPEIRFASPTDLAVRAEVIAHYPNESNVRLVPGHRLSVRFDSSDRDVFLVSPDGLVSPTGRGAATLTATVRRDGTWLANAYVPVTVAEGDSSR